MKNKNGLLIFTLIILGLFFGIKGMIGGSTFFIPLMFAVLIMLICIPLARKLEKFGLSRGLTSFACLLLVILAYLSFFLLITIQGKNIADKWPEMKKNLEPKLEETLKLIEDKTGMNLQDQLPAFLQKEESSDPQGDSKKKSEPTGPSPQTKETTRGSDEQAQSPGKVQSEVPSGIPGKLAPIAMNVFGFFGSSLMTFVYVFFLLSFRAKVKRSILLFFDYEKRKAVEKILNQAVELVLSFLGGRLLLVLFLAIIYAIGLSIAGVENAILISLMAALFSLVPYLGVLIGFIIAITFTLLGGGDTNSLIIVAATYGIAQFVESYILEPYVVGDKVNLNPLMTILVVVAWGMIWGVAGMFLSIPFTAILKIIFDAVQPLKPIGYLLGSEENEDAEEPEKDESEKPKKPEKSSWLERNFWNRVS